ncbi:transporter substrate-binding domain-containing protein [uncultured Martelella sp.]|uniref:transporter substrate-binding domain-containing protein n=1 Tax=uncultured Martelella sp. TaxID=392331 RepID=UPI0029C82FD7|nr:transporter substrate-binding domain-containing protein [uncultured Martelella sp.]
MTSAVTARFFRAVFSLLIGFFLTAMVSMPGETTAWAQEQESEPPQEIRVGYRVTPPFVMRNADGDFTGMATELWKEIEAGLNVTASYTEYETIADLLAAVEAEELDIAVGAISITEDRAEVVDFTQPWFDSGLRIMIDDRSSSSLVNIWNGLAEAGYLRYYGWLLVFIVLGTIGLTFFDRHFDKNFPRRWRDGVSESFYAVMLVVTKGSLPSRSKLFGWIGRVFAAFWLVIGIAVVAYVTSSVTSVMTSIAITGSVTGPDDLPGHTVGVFRGSSAENLVRREGYDFVTYSGIETAVEGLRNAEVDALVADAPVLEYFKAQNPSLGLDVVGRLFAPDKFGFALPYGQDTLIYPVTVRLLALKENGYLTELSQQYFGDER